MGDQSDLKIIQRPEAFFHELVTGALDRQQIATQPETEFYLVNLLNHFISTENLYLRDRDGSYREEPLILMLKEAKEESVPEAQRLLFRHIGDVSLYLAGFFQESLSRKFVDLEYYINLGGIAYQEVSHRADEQVLKGMYDELAQKFGRFVDVFAEVSEKTTPVRNERDLFRLYELWLSTGSDRAAKALQEAGIDPESVFRPGGKVQ